MRLRLLDTFCKAGGAGMGYYQAGDEHDLPEKPIKKDWGFLLELWQQQKPIPAGGFIKKGNHWEYKNNPRG